MCTPYRYTHKSFGFLLFQADFSRFFFKISFKRCAHSPSGNGFEVVAIFFALAQYKIPCIVLQDVLEAMSFRAFFRLCKSAKVKPVGEHFFDPTYAVAHTQSLSFGRGYFIKDGTGNVKDKICIPG